MKYSFEYKVDDAASGNLYNRKESSDGKELRGEYRVLMPDGRTKFVKYSWDPINYFRKRVKYYKE